jgi:CMP-N-acetylneuraminic acid synthetase
MSNSTLGVIPARAGSKRVHKKNIRDVGGKPLIAHTIDQAADADTLDHVIVSTEDEEIGAIAEEHGGNVPFQRPSELAADDVTNTEVIKHALEWFEGRSESFEYVCQLSVTTPFRTSSDIDEALQQLYSSSAKSVVGVTEYETPPFWAITQDGSWVEPYFDENPWKKTRTQEFPSVHHPNGALFAASVSAFEDADGFYTESTTAYEMPRDRSVDIDEPFDLEVARALMSWRNR